MFRLPAGLLKLKYFATPKILGAASLAWTIIVCMYLFRGSISTDFENTGEISSTGRHQPAASSPHERTLVTYVYSESPEALDNFLFFLDHGLHAKADFIFIFNGETNNRTALVPKKSNIKIVERNNTCYDLGAHAEVLTKDDVWLKYKRFVLMNASVRGPFVPHWAAACWSDRLLSKVTEDVKLVGLSLNCWPTLHVQSMVWATDQAGMSLLLYPPKQSPRHDAWMETLFEHPAQFPRPDGYKIEDPDWVERGLNQCFENRQKAVEGEISATGIILGAGKKVDVILMKFQTDPDYEAHCARLGEFDPNAFEGAYDGISIHPFETLFVKTNRGLDERLLVLQTGWMDRSNFSSYDYC